MPMSEDDFNIWCRQLDFPDYTRQLIKQIRCSPPSRTVQGGLAMCVALTPASRWG